MSIIFINLGNNYTNHPQPKYTHKTMFFQLYMKAARIWSQPCEKMEGSSILRREDENIGMEGEINDVVRAKVTPAVSMEVAPARRGEEEGTAGDGPVVGQPSEAHVGLRQKAIRN